MFRPIKNLQDLDASRLSMNQALRLFTTRKKFAVIAPRGGFHLVDNPQRLVMEKYRIDEAYDIEIYEL